MQRITTNQEFLADIIEASVFGILVTDIDGSIEFVNSYCCDLFEYYSDELIGQSIQLLVPQYSQCYESIITALPSTKERRILQLEGIKKSGVKFPVELTLSYISSESQDYIVVYLADITDQQQITDQNTLLSKIFQESLDGIYIIDTETFRFELINSGATEQLGFTQEELQHVHPWDLQPNESRDTFLQRIEPLSTTKNQKITYEGLFKRKDKSEFPVEIHLQRYAYDHRVVYMQMVIDISNRKKSEEAQLLQSEITKNLSEGIVLVQAENSSILYANALLHTMFGYPPGKLINESVSILIATTNRSPIETLSDIISELRTTGSWSGEIYNQHIDGSNFWCWLSISTFTHPAHGAVWVGVLSNIDERKRIEAELNREKQKAQMYLDVAGSIFVVLDKDRCVSLINQKGCEMLGYPEEEILGKDWFANFIPEAERQKVSSVFDQAMRGDISPHEHFVNRIVTRHQGERLIEWQNTVIHNEKGYPIAGLSSGIDITEKTLAEKAMTQALIEGQEIERKRIAKELHDGLGQSLTAIRLHLSALESDLQQFSNKNQHSLDKLKFILQSTVQEVKSISRNLMPSILQDYGLVKAVEFLCQTINDTNEIQVQFQHYGMDSKLDQTQNVGLYRVAQELINNAVKHSGAHRINVQLIGHDQSVVLLVEDDGRGFDPKALKATHPTFGLKNIQTRVKSLAGTLEIDSRPEEGTFATVEIPLY